MHEVLFLHSRFLAMVIAFHPVWVFIIDPSKDHINWEIDGDLFFNSEIMPHQDAFFLFTAEYFISENRISLIQMIPEKDTGIFEEFFDLSHDEAAYSWLVVENLKLNAISLQ